MQILQRFLAYDYNYIMWQGICQVKITSIIKFQYLRIETSNYWTAGATYDAAAGASRLRGLDRPADGPNRAPDSSCGESLL